MIKKKFIFLIGIISILILASGCGEDPLKPYFKPIAVLQVTPETAIVDLNQTDSIFFTADPTGSRCEDLNSSQLWARLCWNSSDSLEPWGNWQGLDKLLQNHPVYYLFVDSNLNLPQTRIVLLEVASPDGTSDTAQDTIYIINE
ncbi:MAG: hypothetical protein APR63_06715 [Desulfuromonas sp. SDB]|nr:MAG: hypothetical protein APR63_06715 [Desulfuromonas sp. SDB]